MDLPKIILVASDFSACSQEATAFVTKLAQRLEARVCLLHCWQLPMPGPSPEMGWVLTQDMIVFLEGEARSALEAATAKVRETLPGAESRLLQSDPRHGIVETANEIKADLVIVGTHGRRGIPRMLLGSVAEYVVRHAPCTVLTVRTPEPPKA